MIQNKKPQTFIESQNIIQGFIKLLNNEGKLQKGSLSKICMIGGSREYHGAAIISSKAAISAGSELNFILNEDQQICSIFKHQSTDFIVPNQSIEDFNTKNIIKDLRVKCVIIGCGMSSRPINDPLLTQVSNIQTDKDYEVISVIDADGIKNTLELFKSYELNNIEVNKSTLFIFTPNMNEVKQILEHQNESGYFYKSLINITKNNPNIKVLLKGKIDVFFDLGELQELKFEELDKEIEKTGVQKRPGGIGDCLAGTVCTLASLWLKAKQSKKDNEDFDLPFYIYMASYIVRTKYQFAVRQHGYSLTADHLNNQSIQQIINNIHSEGLKF